MAKNALREHAQSSSHHPSDPYPSRVSESWRLIERVDPIIWGERPGPLDAALLAHYQQHGFILLERLFSDDDVAHLASVAHTLARTRADNPDDPEVIREPEHRAVRSIFRVHQTDDVFATLVRHPVLTAIARQLLDDDIYVHQSRINFKPGFHGQPFQWHSDFETWHCEDGMPRMRALSASIMLADNNAFNGPLLVIPGSHTTFVQCVGATPPNHHTQSLREQRIGTPSHRALHQLIDTHGLTAITAPAGSVILFDCNLLHASNANLSPYPRHNIFIVYNSLSNTLTTPFAHTTPRPSFLAEQSPVAL